MIAVLRLSDVAALSPQKVIGSEHRSVFDLAVFDKGRLVFCAKPEVSADGYSVVDADVTMLNEGGGKLDLSSFSFTAS